MFRKSAARIVRVRLKRPASEAVRIVAETVEGTGETKTLLHTSGIGANLLVCYVR